MRSDAPQRAKYTEQREKLRSKTESRTQTAFGLGWNVVTTTHLFLAGVLLKATRSSQPHLAAKPPGQRWPRERNDEMPRTDFSVFHRYTTFHPPTPLTCDVLIYDDDTRVTHVYAGLDQARDESGFRAWAAVAFDAEIDGEWPRLVARTASRDA